MACFSLASITLFCAFPLALCCLEVVSTDNGPIRGTCSERSNAFLGIPFASPPVGSLRWRPPSAAAPWTEIRNTTEYGPACMQVKGAGIDEISEDCLFLNVWVPPNATAAANLSVMVWIHGGTFIHGAGSLYDGTYLMEFGVVVVTLNYRLGPFAALALPELSEESDTTGFYGIIDQRAAMQWVKRNIKNFGGNPDQITLFGESAGAISVCAHIAAPGSANLFAYALMESGFCTLEDYSSRVKQSQELAQIVGCPNAAVECLRGKQASEILLALPESANWFPIVDNVELNKQPIQYLEEGTFNKVPFFAGANLNEESLFLCPDYENITAEQYEDLIVQNFGPKVGAEALQLYPEDAYPTPVQALITLYTDNVFVCPIEKAMDAMSSAGVPTYMYSFQYKPGFSVGNCLGVAHAFELPFIFPGILHFSSNYTLNAKEKVLSFAMRALWTTFAQFGQPGYQSFEWPAFNIKEEYVAIEEVALAPGFSFREKYCSFWSQVPTITDGMWHSLSLPFTKPSLS